MEESLEDLSESDEIAVKEIVNEDETEKKYVKLSTDRANKTYLTTPGALSDDDYLRSYQDAVVTMAGSQLFMGSDDTTSMIQIQNNCMIQTIDNVPYPTEERKIMSAITARMCSFVHNCNQPGLRQYGVYLSKKYPGTKGKAYEILLAIHDLDCFYVQTRYDKAQQMCARLEKTIQSYDGPYSDSLHIRFLTSKGSLLYRQGKRKESEAVLTEAIIACDRMRVNCSHGYAYRMFALCVLEPQSVDHSAMSSDEMRQAAVTETEHMLLRGYRSNQIWIEDLKEDHKLEESLIKFFWVWPSFSYVFALLRFDAEYGTRVDEDQLEKAKNFLDNLKSESESFSPRATLNYHMAWCDYYLRCAQIKPNYNDALLSYSMAVNKIAKCQRKFEENPGLFIRGEERRVNARQKYIKSTCGDAFVSSLECEPDMNYSMDSLQTRPKVL